MAEQQLGTAPSDPTDTATKGYVDTAVAAASVPYDLSLVGFGIATTRVASSYGDNTFGIKLQRACTLTSVTFRFATADASGNLVAVVTRNGSSIAASSTTIAAASQVAGGTTTFSQACSAGDVIAIYISSVGTTPGKGLAADIKGNA